MFVHRLYLYIYFFSVREQLFSRMDFAVLINFGGGFLVDNFVLLVRWPFFSLVVCNDKKMSKKCEYSYNSTVSVIYD